MQCALPALQAFCEQCLAGTCHCTRRSGTMSRRLTPFIDGVGGDAKACMAVYNIVADTPHALNPFDRFTQICLFGVKSCISNETESELGVCCE